MNDPLRDALTHFDVHHQTHVQDLIIGSGVGGSLCADWYSRQGRSVLVLEEGMDISEIASPFTLERGMSSMWREGGIVPVESNARFVFAEGRVVGGGSMVNAGILHRLPEPLRAQWAERYRIARYTQEDLAPFFKEAEQTCGNVSSAHNRSSPQAERFDRGAHQKGWETISPLTTIRSHATQPVKRQSMRATYLARAATQGAQILSRTRAVRILFHGSKARAVEAEHTTIDGKRFLLTITCERLILACGALQTPLLLRRSGMTKHIGDSLRFHPTLRISALFPGKIEPWKELMSPLQIKSLAPDISFGMSLGWPPHLATSLMPEWPASQALLSSLDKLAIYYVMTPSHGRGFVRPLGRRHYRVGYHLVPQDIHLLQKGYGELIDLLERAGATSLIGSIRTEAKHKETWSARDLFAMSIHAFSSCPMGEADDCPVDSYGGLKGTDNISIQDASLLPEAPSVNPQLTIMATVLRNLTHRS